MEYAGIRIYIRRDEKDLWKQLNASPMLGHSLTVTQMVFSADSRYLLSLSRDRSWMIHDFHSENLDIVPKLVACKKNAHTRVIWSGCFLHTCDSSLLIATVSRDKFLKIWKIVHDPFSKRNAEASISLIASYPSSTSAPTSISSISQNQMIVGYENGTLNMVLLQGENSINDVSIDLPGGGHYGPITSILSWSTADGLFIASGGEDTTFRIHQVVIPVSGFCLN